MQGTALIVAAAAMTAVFTGWWRPGHVDAAGAEGSFMEDVKVVHVTSDTVDWTADIGRVIIDSRRNISSIRDVTFLFPSMGLTVTSEMGRYDMKSDALVLEGAVVAKRRGMTIETGSLRWDPSRQEVRTDDRVHITGDAFSVSGRGMVMDESGDLILLKDVKARVHSR